MDEQQVRDIIARDFPDKSVKEVVPIVIGFNLVAFEGSDDITIVNNDGGHLSFKLSETTVDEAVEAYKQGKRD